MAVAQSMPAVSATVLAERSALSPVLRTFVIPSVGFIPINTTSHFGSSVAKPNVGCTSSPAGHARARRLGRDEDVDLEGEVIADDFYSVLGVTPDATPEEIKKAYYSCMKVCHPDLSGNNPETTAFCMFVNEVYEYVSHSVLRRAIEEDMLGATRLLYTLLVNFRGICRSKLLGVSLISLYTEDVFKSAREFGNFGCLQLVLIDPEQRLIYDEINGYALTAANPFLNDDHEKDHAFVDEFSCIGCKNCANTAPKSFEIEMEFGRARVLCQKGDPALVQRAIETCPVDCIHWVTPAQLTLLEDEMRRIERVNVGMMLSGMGSQTPDVFAQASWRWDKRQSKALEKARRRMMQEGAGAWWDGMWNPVSGAEGSRRSDGEEARKRAARTAAAARRWREYSRQGLDRRATKVLAAAQALNAEDEGNEQEKETASV